MLCLASLAVSEHRKYALMNETPFTYAPLPMLPHTMHPTKHAGIKMKEISRVASLSLAIPS